MRIGMGVCGPSGHSMMCRGIARWTMADTYAWKGCDMEYITWHSEALLGQRDKFGGLDGYENEYDGSWGHVTSWSIGWTCMQGNSGCGYVACDGSTAYVCGNM